MIMNRKQINIPICLAGFSLILSISSTNAQTIVKPGEISGIWNKKSSPYMIRGDLNIPSGKTLIIQPGVIVRFTGPYRINVQGNLIA